jgi:hypothetical protein
MKRWLNIMLLLLVATPIIVIAQNSQIEVTASVDKQTAYIGDIIDYSITIEYDSTISLAPPAVGANLGAFEIKDYDIGEEKVLENNRRQLILRFAIRTFTTGDYVIPPLPVQYTLPDSTEKTIASEPVKITIKSLLAEGEAVDSLKPKPLKAQASLSSGNSRGWILAVCAFVLIAGGVVGYFLWRRKKQIAQEPVDLRTPWEIAYTELSLLKEKNLPEQGELKLFYIELTDILRRYLGRKFEFNAIDLTTDEIRDYFVEHGYPGELTETMADFLAHADLVKFAKFIPGDDRPDQDWQQAYELVTATRDIMPHFAPAEQPELVRETVFVAEEKDLDPRFKYMPPELRERMAADDAEDRP